MNSTLTINDIKGKVFALYLNIKSSLINDDDNEPPTGVANAYNKTQEYYEEKQGKKYDWKKLLKPFKPIDTLDVIRYA